MSQISIILLFSAQFYLLKYDIKIITGSVLSSKILGVLPLVDPFASVEKMISYRSTIVFYPAAFLITLGVYVMLGRLFCGWICPIDLVCSIEKPGKTLNVRTNQIMYLTIFFFAIMLFLSYFLRIPIYTNYLHPLAMSSIIINGFGSLLISSHYNFSNMFYAIFIIISFLIIDTLLGNRFWCKTLCPTGIIYGLFNKLSRIRIKVKPELCVDCGECDKVCPTRIPITSNYIKNKLSIVKSIDCIKCLECVELCPTKALELEVK